MKLQFDPDQSFQRDAIKAVVDIFEGQPSGDPEFSVIKRQDSGPLLDELGSGNRLLLDDDVLRENTRAVQERNDIEVDDPAADLEGWLLCDASTEAERRCPHFSVEMETGTGKTYVYLRMIFDLSQRYGFQKFVVVVPSIAIREGVLKNLEVTSDHFRALYNNQPCEHFVYDSRRVNRLRHFATANTLQIMVMNIQAFRREENVIHRESDQMGGRPPIEFVQKARPIVIIDEPQSVDATAGAQVAIRTLNPLCTLRFSATHRDPYNLVYRLDPVQAFELKLVKQIIVASAEEVGVGYGAFVRLEKLDKEKGIRARLLFHTQTADGPRKKRAWIKLGDDLYKLSNQRTAYEQGFEVVEISTNPEDSFVGFSGGRRLVLGETMGGRTDDISRAQIRHTIMRHLAKELEVSGRGIKVLSLFFIDRVANYRDYNDEGLSVRGKFARMFEEEFANFAHHERFAGIEWLRRDPGTVHNGYFASDRRGQLKDTKGASSDDERVYDLIMTEKERLLSLDEPLRFIFSHSALREGWDNPNVFQICTLNETQSTVKKRQEIGRGLRLPVDQDGMRVFDESINRLLVVANENYEDFATALQSEYEDECGFTFGKVPLRAFSKLARTVERERKFLDEPIGREAGERLRGELITLRMLDKAGFILDAFEPDREGFELPLSAEFTDLAAAVEDLLSGYRIQRHVRRERDERQNLLKKEVMLGAEFAELWSRIRPKTRYRVVFDTDQLVSDCVRALDDLTIRAPRVRVSEALVSPEGGGVRTSGVSARDEIREYVTRDVPDLLSYLQAATDLTRSTLVRILVDSGHLELFFKNPQQFMDDTAAIIRTVLQGILVQGIQYERLGDGPESVWEMSRFENEELVNQLNALQVRHSIYEYVPCGSKVERTFAKRLDERSDIKLFVKLPSWFRIDTPVGEYNPDWAIVKEENEALYLVRETKGSHDPTQLRASEDAKIRSGKRHFEALDVDFAVAVSADEV